jgi:hypothetical protein
MTTLVTLTIFILAILFISGFSGQGHSQMMPPGLQSAPDTGENSQIISPGNEIANGTGGPQMMPPGGQMPNGMAGVPSQTMPPGGQMPNGMAGVPSQMMPPGIQIPKMVEGKYVNTEYGMEMELAEGLKGMETFAEGSTNVMVFFGGGPGAMAGPEGMVSNPNAGTGGMPDLSTFMISFTDPSKIKQTNETASPLLDSGVTNPVNVPMNKTELPKIDCKPGSSETVNIGGKNAQLSTSDCTVTSLKPKGTMYMKSKDYTIDLGAGKSANIRYSVMSSSSSESAASAYDSNLGKFDETVKTIKFTK